ncbi:hypothetical protein FOMPIDRAFT_152263 [Fomitopsis schrenkii]|uniref:Uncharacterized protein n=1 Tax=Fomitopsis schrenkii TaxID=2126942 RepID=S8DZV5_FOMSC|nr:hypothetical protein FOMPIDRAFT_152263 [Fomitopsis schrenkii]
MPATVSPHPRAGPGTYRVWRAQVAAVCVPRSTPNSRLLFKLVRRFEPREDRSSTYALSM